jgi:hypothetical protein
MSGTCSVGMRSRLRKAYVATKLFDTSELNARARQSFSDGGLRVRLEPPLRARLTFQPVQPAGGGRVRCNFLDRRNM